MFFLCSDFLFCAHVSLRVFCFLGGGFWLRSRYRWKFPHEIGWILKNYFEWAGKHTQSSNNSCQYTIYSLRHGCDTFTASIYQLVAFLQKTYRNTGWAKNRGFTPHVPHGKWREPHGPPTKDIQRTLTVPALMDKTTTTHVQNWKTTTFETLRWYQKKKCLKP